LNDKGTLLPQAESTRNAGDRVSRVTSWYDTPMIDLLHETRTRDLSWRAAASGVKHLYIHVPFCHRRCAYCDFNTYANMEDRMEAYVDALCAELGALRPGDQETSRQGDGQSMQQSPALPLSRSPCLVRADLRPTIFL